MIVHQQFSIYTTCGVIIGKKQPNYTIYGVNFKLLANEKANVEQFLRIWCHRQRRRFEVLSQALANQLAGDAIIAQLHGAVVLRDWLNCPTNF